MDKSKIADKEIEIATWMRKKGYDRRASKDIAPIIVEYLREFKLLNLHIVNHRFLLDELRAVAKQKRYISIEDFIKQRTTNWKQVDELRGAFEQLLNENHLEEFTYERTSEIFITKGTKRGEINLRYFPKHNDFLISHIVFRNGG